MNEHSRRSGKELYTILYPLLHKDLLGNYPFKPIHEKLMGFCAERGLKCIDALPAFESHRSMKPFIVHEVDYHPNGAANRVVSKFLHETERFDIQ